MVGGNGIDCATRTRGWFLTSFKAVDTAEDDECCILVADLVTSLLVWCTIILCICGSPHSQLGGMTEYNCNIRQYNGLYELYNIEEMSHLLRCARIGDF